MPLYPLLLPAFPTEETSEVLTHQPDHVGIGVGHLIEQFRTKPRIRALLTAFLTQCQDIEDMFWGLLTERGLDTTVKGAVLDNLGRILKQPRNGYDDDTYLLFLKARILVNRSSGRPEDLIGVLLAIFGATLQMRADDRAGEFAAILNQQLTFRPQIIVQILAQARPAGRRFALEYSEQDLSTAFIYGDANAAASDANGYGDALNPGTGGYRGSVMVG